MKQEQLLQLANQNAPPPRGVVGAELVYYEALRGLYGLHRAGALDQSAAAERRRALDRARQMEQEAATQRMAIHRQTQESIKRAGTLRGDLNKGLRDGAPADRLLPLAVEIIKRMVGETV